MSFVLFKKRNRPYLHTAQASAEQIWVCAWAFVCFAVPRGKWMIRSSSLEKENRSTSRRMFHSPEGLNMLVPLPIIWNVFIPLVRTGHSVNQSYKRSFDITHTGNCCKRRKKVVEVVDYNTTTTLITAEIIQLNTFWFQKRAKQQHNRIQRRINVSVGKQPQTLKTRSNSEIIYVGFCTWASFLSYE